jgi:ribosomal protein S12 methylthiotransferase accessory factor
VRVHTWAHALARAGLPSPAADDVREFDDHVRFYADARNVARVDFLDGSTRRRSIGRLPGLLGTTHDEWIAAVCRRLARRGVSAYAVDLTPCDLRAAGLAVVRVIAPELCGLDVEHRARLHGGRRLYDEPRRLCMRPRTLTEDELNPDPHPFP